MEILKDDKNKLMLIWTMPIQTMTTVKNDKSYHSFKVSFPSDLKKYIERNGNSLDTVDFYEWDNEYDDGVGVPEFTTFIAIGGSLPDGAKLVASPKLVSFKKKSQLFVTLPKKVHLFKSLNAGVKSVLNYSLVYNSSVDDYVLLVDVVDSGL